VTHVSKRSSPKSSQPTQPNRPRHRRELEQLFAELKRRNVYKVMLANVVG